GYLAVHHECPNCSEALHHQRADDGPAWATLVVTGHLLAPLMLLMWDLWQPSPIVMASTLSVFLVAVSLFLLPRFKGAFIGLQWSRRMHGFGAEADGRTNQWGGRRRRGPSRSVMRRPSFSFVRTADGHWC